MPVGICFGTSGACQNGRLRAGRNKGKGRYVAEKRDRVLKAVMAALENDYAGMPEKALLNDTKQWLTAFGEAWKAGRLDDALFVSYLTQYLATFQDPNLALLVSDVCPCQPWSCGFSVRRFGDELYVTEVREDERFTVGDALVLLNRSIPDKHLDYAIGNPVNGDDPDRQLWDDLVSRCAHVLVRHADGTEEDVAVRRFRRSQVAPMGLPGALPDGAIVERGDAVVVDLRRVPRVLDDASCDRVLAALLPERLSIADLMGDEAVFTNYTADNCAIRRSQLETLRKGASACERAWVDEEIERIGSLEGAGMVREVERDDRVAGGANAGRPVVLLTDVTTSAAGERIVQVARAAAEQGLVEVHVVGRATSGAIDYVNPLAVSFDEFYTFVYPMSKSEAAARGEGVSGRGVEPDVAVPFTPDECREDRVRKRALDLVCG